MGHAVTTSLTITLHRNWNAAHALWGHHELGPSSAAARADVATGRNSDLQRQWNAPGNSNTKCGKRGGSARNMVIAMRGMQVKRLDKSGANKHASKSRAQCQRCHVLRYATLRRATARQAGARSAPTRDRHQVGIHVTSAGKCYFRYAHRSHVSPHGRGDLEHVTRRMSLCCSRTELARLHPSMCGMTRSFGAHRIAVGGRLSAPGEETTANGRHNDVEPT